MINHETDQFSITKFTKEVHKTDKQIWFEIKSILHPSIQITGLLAWNLETVNLHEPKPLPFVTDAYGRLSGRGEHDQDEINVAEYG